MPDWSKGQIYKLISKNSNDVYIGSTTQTLNARYNEHTSDYRKYQKDKGYYMTSYNVLDKGDCEMVLLEKYPTENRKDLHEREKFWIKSLKCVNKYIPGRTAKEYRQDNAVKIRAYDRKRWPKRAEKENARKKEKVKCECGIELTRGCLPRHKRLSKFHLNKTQGCLID